MGKKLLHTAVGVHAVICLYNISGLPGAIRLTVPRLGFMLLTLLGCAAWLLLNRGLSALRHRKKALSLLFQTLIVTAAGCLILRFFMNRVSCIDSSFKTILAFVQQAEPFLTFAAVLCLCAAFLLLRGQSLRALLAENTAVFSAALLFCVCLLIFGAYLPVRENYYPSHDYAIFSYIGQQILKGKMPYTELWDHKPPLIFYLNALGLKLAGGSLLGIWLLEFAAFFAGALMLCRLLKKAFPTGIALPVLSLGLLNYVRLLDFGNYTEEFSLFFAICALSLFFAKPRNRRFAFLSGLLCGLAFTCKQNTVGFWGAMFLLDLLRPEPRKDLRQLLRYWGMLLTGFLLVNAGWVIYFAAHGALAAYWDVAFRFNLVYSEHSTANRLACAWTTLTFLPSFSPYLLLAMLYGIFTMLRHFQQKNWQLNAENRPLCVWALLDLPIELVFAGLSGMNYQHYFILCLPALIILMGALIRDTSEHIKSKTVQWAIPVLLAALTILPLLPLFRADYEPRTPSAYTKARDYLLTDTLPEDPILVWGSRSAIYVMSERSAPTAYFNERPLYLFAEEAQRGQWDELLSDLRQNPPEVIIYTHDSALPFVNFAADGTCQAPDAAPYKQSVYNYFCKEYHYDFTLNEGARDAWEVYRRSQSARE